MSTFTKEYLMGLADSLAKTVTDPKFLAHVEEIQKAGNTDEQYALAQKSSADCLREEGLELPDGFRAVPRTFEDPAYARANGVQPLGREPGSDREEIIPESFDKSSWPDQPLLGQPDQMDKPETIARYLKEGLYEIAEFVSGDSFRALLTEMSEVSPEARPAFILDVVLNEQERIKRGIEVPKNMLIQRSTFHDGRPTLFCVSALTPLGYPWRKVTFTFDNQILDRGSSLSEGVSA